MIDGDRIQKVIVDSPSPTTPGSLDFPQCVVLPGLVNAHAHLEMTHVAGAVQKRLEFTQWLRTLTQELRNADEADPDARERGAADGIKMCLESGTTTVCDIANTGVSFEEVCNNGLRGIVLYELLGFRPDRAIEYTGRAASWFADHEDHSRVALGVSAHAPYSVSADLFRGAAKIADKENRLLAIHVAETEEEERFLHTGLGPFKEHLEFYNAYDPGFAPPCTSPIRYLSQLGVLGRPRLLIHCNYLDDEEIQIIADSGSSVVYCPRSHAYFGHSNHPYPRLREAGVNVAIGTDSLASNESLSILDEMRFLQDKGIVTDLGELIGLATENGAKALQMDATIGAIMPGMKADFTVVRIPDDTTPETGLLDLHSRVEAVIVDGVPVYPTDD